MALALPARGGEPMVTVGPGASLRGVALDGGGAATALSVPAGAASIGGPLRVVNAALALDVGEADVTVAGGQAAPVRLSGNAAGVRVGPAAKRTRRGDGTPGGLAVEDTAGAARLVLAGGSSAAVTVERANFRAGAVGVEIRRGRAVTLRGCAFARNQRSVSLNAENTPDTGLFFNVAIADNDFSQALPAAGQGTAICGSRLGSNGTTLQLGAGNVFPSGSTCSDLD